MRSALRLVHYWWPVLLGASLTLVLRRGVDRAFDVTGFAMFLCGIAAAYSLDRVFDRSGRADPAWLRRVLQLSGAITLFGGGMLLLRLPWQTASLIPVLGVATLSYPSLKRIPLLKTVVVSIVWTWSAIALPFHDGSWFGWRWIFVPVALPLLLLMASGCVLCDLKDAVSDRESRVASLPVLFGARATANIAVVLAIAGVGTAVIERRPGLAMAGLSLSVASAWPALLSSESVGPLIVDAILTLPGILIACHLI